MYNWTRAELKMEGKLAFKANYWKCVLVGIILALLTAGGASYSGSQGVKDGMNGDSGVTDITDIFSQNPAYAAGFTAALLVIALIAIAVTLALSAFIFNPLVSGARYFFYRNLEDPQNVGLVGTCFQNGYKSAVKTLFFMELKLIGWTLLFIVPGIIKTYEYAMIPYIVADNPEIDTKEAFAKSREMMTGNKWKMFVLQLSFIGWDILAIITLGLVGIFYSAPYQYSTEAALYKRLKGETAANAPADAAVDASYTVLE